MKSSLRFAILFSSIGLALPAIADQESMNDANSASAGHSIGTVNFQVNCGEAVRADVDHALGMMHHMMYTQARSEFEAVVQTEPGCAMAHWGIATTLFQPLWGTVPGAADIARGREAIQKAREAAQDPREKSLIEATGAYFDPETDMVRERLAGWIKGMEASYQAYPDDLDVSTLYALSRMTPALSSDDPKALLRMGRLPRMCLMRCICLPTSMSGSGIGPG